MWLPGALKFALRSLRRSPLFAVTATLSLAIGVAANTIGFAFLYGYLVRPLPYADGDRLVSVMCSDPRRGHDRWPVNLQEMGVLRDRDRPFDAVAAGTIATLNLTGAGEPRRVETAVVSAHLFQLVGLRPFLGRLFTKADEEGASGRVVVLAEGFWRSTFGADPNIIGRAIALDREPYTVVGVLPAWPAWGAWGKLYTPIDKGLMAQPGERRYRLVARLAPGVDVEQANRELEGLSVSLAAAYPKDNEGVRIFAEDLRADLLDDRDDAILVLYGVVSLLLLLACANVATLLVMRSASRSGEFAIRASLGGRRIQIVRQLLVEHAVVTLAGGGFGFLLGL